MTKEEAITVLRNAAWLGGNKDRDHTEEAVTMAIKALEQPEIIRCKDCKWWDKYGNYDNGYCVAAKHCYLSEHWEIRIRRTYKGDFYCADAERRTDGN